MTKEKILIFSYHQFGSLVDSLKYCQYAKGKYDFTYMGWNYNNEKTEIDNVNCRYISRSGSLLKRNIRLLLALNEEISKNNYDVVLTHYTRGISLVRLFNMRQKMILDVRTLSVNSSKIKRYMYNLGIKFECIFFKHYSVISEGVARQLNLKQHYILPLGADIITPTVSKDLNKLNLLYVGTLYNRDIIKCVKGLERYIEKTGDKDVNMTIIGDSCGSELEDIKSYVNFNTTLSNRINCLGRIEHSKLNKYFEQANVGVSYIPMTKFYEHQPPTKTYEYLLSGLPVIATNTYENHKLISDEETCILINDTIEDFTEAIILMKKKIKHIDNLSIIERYSQYTWHNIVNNTFISIIDKVISK